MDSFIHNHTLFYRKEWRSSYNTSFDLYVYTVHNQAIPQQLMYVEIEIQLLCFPNTAIVYTLSRALSGLLKEQADYLIAIISTGSMSF